MIPHHHPISQSFVKLWHSIGIRHPLLPASPPIKPQLPPSQLQVTITFLARRPYLLLLPLLLLRPPLLLHLKYMHQLQFHYLKDCNHHCSRLRLLNCHLPLAKTHHLVRKNQTAQHGTSMINSQLRLADSGWDLLLCSLRWRKLKQHSLPQQATDLVRTRLCTEWRLMHQLRLL